ncbi:hypothetical protein EX30DRAFT_349463 [Ascodesmis nigricans]|uniref:Uncharacterized protein n=1 Tax=Ascodesmis nigricans TaxID=341454 RepID=A0A4S2MUY4_9PEZI|nr:hypothetical protein EX30DRAFT_349463 [Ascodesmis nigricans]
MDQSRLLDTDATKNPTSLIVSIPCEYRWETIFDGNTPAPKNYRPVYREFFNYDLFRKAVREAVLTTHFKEDDGEAELAGPCYVIKTVTVDTRAVPEVSEFVSTVVAGNVTIHRTLPDSISATLLVPFVVGADMHFDAPPCFIKRNHCQTPHIPLSKDRRIDNTALTSIQIETAKAIGSTDERMSKAYKICPYDLSVGERYVIPTRISSNSRKIVGFVEACGNIIGYHRAPGTGNWPSIGYQEPLVYTTCVTDLVI